MSPLPVAWAGICVGTFASGPGSVRLHLLWLLSACQLFFMTSEARQTSTGLTRKMLKPFNLMRANCQSPWVGPPSTDLLAELMWAALFWNCEWELLEFSDIALPLLTVFLGSYCKGSYCSPWDIERRIIIFFFVIFYFGSFLC